MPPNAIRRFHRGGVIRYAARIGRRKWSRSAAVLLGVVGLAASVGTEAADPQPYTVAIAATGNDALDKALDEASRLQSLRTKSKVAPFALISRAREDVNRFQTVLHSFGYYDGTATVAIDGRPLDDPTLADVLGKVPAGQSVKAQVTVHPGPLYHLGRVAIAGPVPPDARAQLGLAPGQPAVAADVLAAGARLLAAMQEDGYALATVAPPDAVAHPQSHTLDVTFHAADGRRAVIGAIRFKGLSHVNESFVRRRLLVHRGQLYRPSEIDKARQDLASLGVFSSVSVRAGSKIAPDGTLPLEFDVQERPRHAVTVTGAFSTDLGGSLSTTWSHRNLFGNAEQLNLTAAGTGLGGTAIKGLGYNFAAQFLKPDFLRRDQTLELDLAALKQDLQAYNQRAITAGAALHRKLSERWQVSLGVSAEHEVIEQEGVTRTYTLVSLPLTVKYDSTGLTNPLLDPTHGIRAAATVTPTQSLGGKSSSFVVFQANGATYLDLGHYWHAAPGRSVLALRGVLGSVQGAGVFALPPDQRFYGGGSTTVRGFKYQSIGPLFPDNNPVGGTSIDAGTVEYRQRLFDNFGAVAFVDAGQVSEQSLPFRGTLRVGAGIGGRYYTPIGPVRLDIAVPLNRPRGGDAFEIYLGLGQAF